MNMAPKQAPPKQSPILPVLALGILIIAAAVAYKALHSNSQALSPAPTQASAGTPSAPAPPPTAGPAEPREDVVAPSDATPAPLPGPTVAVRADSTVDPKDLVAILAALTGKEPITADQARKWKESLQQLIRQGASSVPAIQQFLAQNLDASYVGVSGSDALGYNSLRAALLDALGQIGGPESTQAILQVLQTSIFPTDIATLAKTLDAQGPGQYQQAILDAVRQQLNMGALDQLGGANVLPLFQVLANEAASGANLSADLTQYAEKWPYYSAIALGALPDGSGVPSLIQLAQGTVAGNQAAAAQELAELAPQNTLALSSLLDMAKNGQLSDTILAQLAPFLAGRQYELGPPQDPTAGGFQTYHMVNGNEDFSSSDTSGTLTQAQIAQRIAIIDQLLQVIPVTDSATQDALQGQRNALAGRQQP
jgi:HEAT repeat protein